MNIYILLIYVHWNLDKGATATLASQEAQGQNPAEYSAALGAVKAKTRSKLQPGSKTLGKKKPRRSRIPGALF